MTLTLARAVTEAQIASCMALRWEVFVVEQGVQEADELDGTDEGCVHVLASREGQVLGAARYKPEGDSIKIGRVCVARAARGQGIGAALIKFACQDSGAKSARLGAQLDALRFYEGLGFRTQGAVFIDAGIEHQIMVKALA